MVCEMGSCTVYVVRHGCLNSMMWPVPERVSDPDQEIGCCFNLQGCPRYPASVDHNIPQGNVQGRKVKRLTAD